MSGDDPLDIIEELNRQPFRTWSPHGYYIDRYTLDKTPDCWMVTHHPSGHYGAVLRLKVRLAWLEEPDWFVCEARLNPCDPFQEIRQGRDLWYFAIADPPDYPGLARDMYFSFPAQWRPEFWQMARRVAGVLQVIHLDFCELAGDPDAFTMEGSFEKLLENSADLDGYYPEDVDTWYPNDVESYHDDQ